MKKLINGKLYDTDTSELITSITIVGEYDSYFIFEYLYRKKTGEFFLYREMVGDSDCEYEWNWVRSHRFQPLSLDETKKWTESADDVDLYIELFGEVDE